MVIRTRNLPKIQIGIFFLALFTCQKPGDPDPNYRPLLSYQFDRNGSQNNAFSRTERASLIREGARDAGIRNAALLAGIASTETGMAHCWDEATWSCQGPASSDCGGRPVIAGASDGACSLQQGGLCMFQFDSGGYGDTLDRYGKGILTVRGCTAAVVPFLITRAIQSVPEVSNEQEAKEWINSIPIREGDPRFVAWIKFISWRYNGCKDCPDVEEKYRQRTLDIVQEFGPEFWDAEPNPDSALEPTCSTMKVQGIGDDHSLKVRSSAQVLGATNVVGRIIGGQVFEVLERADGHLVRDDLNNKLQSRRWISMKAILPRGEELRGWITSIYTTCAD